MIGSLILAIIISLFSIGACLALLWRFRDWRLGFLAGLTLFASIWVLISILSQIAPVLEDVNISSAGFERYFHLLVLSLMSLSAMFFLEKIVKGRVKRTESMRLAQVSLDHASIPVIWLTPAGQITYVNKGARECLGYEEPELLAMTIHDVAQPCSAADWTRHWATLCERGSVSFELHCRTQDGKLFPADVTAIHVTADTAELACAFVRDITERKQAEADLRVAIAEADAANRAKGEFLRSMSHELRTPLNAIIGFSEVMESQAYGPLGSPRYMAYVNDVLYAARHLLGIINGVLDLSKAEASRLVLEEDELEVSDLLNQCLRLVRERAAKKQLEISVENPPGELVVRADPRIMLQILINLVSNAVKFTPEGGRISISAHLAAEGGCIISVTDTGCGIADSDLERVMEPFVQTGNALTRRHEGTGLGLPLVKMYTELHGGRLAVTSTLGSGTTVSVHLPPERTVPYSDVEAAAPHALGSLTGTEG